MAAFLDRMPLRGGVSACANGCAPLVATRHAHRRNTLNAVDAQARRHTPPRAFCLRAKRPFACKCETCVSSRVWRNI